MTESDPVFDAVFDGQPPQQFLTLQDAMNWAEDLDRPTGTISFESKAIIRYDSGNIAVVE
jgi:hypothetical protein